jgi:hypothetical protein
LSVFCRCCNSLDFRVFLTFAAKLRSVSHKKAKKFFRLFDFLLNGD